MCREAMDGYLRDSTGVDQATLDRLREQAVGSQDERVKVIIHCHTASTG